MEKGYVAIVLHAHLPYVHHPEHESIIEERWLFEAISETYIPLITYLERLIEENVDYRITMSLSPTLLAMLSSPLLQGRYIKYLIKLIELTENEIVRTKNQPEFNMLARMYNEKYKHDLYIFREKYHCNIISAFKNIRDKGRIEIISCAATHGYLPLMENIPESIKAQINMGVKSFERYFKEKPKGIWLPECGYTPAVENHLKENDIEYFITESHGVKHASPRPVFGTYSPIVTPKGLVVFGRDTLSSRQVWSSTEGYPGDFDYREYYRDIGYDLDYNYIKDYISPDGDRIATGIKYYRITGKTSDKQPYNPEWARNKADVHAENFMFDRCKQIEFASEKIEGSPIIVCPYDAELFGHWWFEGPYWLYSFIKKTYYNQNTFKLITLSEYISENPVMQVASPSPSSWGLNGYNETWLNNSNDWIYKHLHLASKRMVELASENTCASGIKEDALNQAARELLLAQSSDWAFIMKAGTMVQYAVKRTTDHIGNFTRLYNDIKDNNIDTEWLRNIEYRNSIFPDMDYRIYKGVFSPIKGKNVVDTIGVKEV